MTHIVSGEGAQRTDLEHAATQRYAELFDASSVPTATKLSHFPKWIRRQDATRFLARYEVFKRVLQTKGSIIECGVWHGFGLMSWAHFSAILEPNNLIRRIYGFDTFTGFPDISPQDTSSAHEPRPGDLAGPDKNELHDVIRAHDMNRFLGHVPKVAVIAGNAVETIPRFVADHPHLVVSLLFLDFDLYEPTRIALEHFTPRMPRGAVIAFDELDNPAWPGETEALLDTLGIGKLRLQRLEFDPYIGFAVIEG